MMPLSAFESTGYKGPRPGPMPAEPAETLESRVPEAPEPVEGTLESRTEDHPPHFLSPDAVCFRHEEEVCGNCEYQQADGFCQIIGLAVTPGASCNAFEYRGEEQQNAEGAGAMGTT